MSDLEKQIKPMDRADDLALLLAAVEGLLGDVLIPRLPDFEKYHSRVARNVLGIVRRQISAEGIFTELDQHYLPMFGLTAESSQAELSQRIECGELEQSDTLMDYLKRRTLLQLEIDNPSYWGCAMAKEQWAESLEKAEDSDL